MFHQMSNHQLQALSCSMTLWKSNNFFKIIFFYIDWDVVLFIHWALLLNSLLHVSNINKVNFLFYVLINWLFLGEYGDSHGHVNEIFELAKDHLASGHHQLVTTDRDRVIVNSAWDCYLKIKEIKLLSTLFFC